jgi:hypothetical protein
LSPVVGLLAREWEWHCARLESDATIAQQSANAFELHAFPITKYALDNNLSKIIFE